MGIGVVLPGAVLLVADGRRTLPLLGDEVVEDDVQKIIPIHDGLAVIRFGVSHATELAVDQLRTSETRNERIRDTVESIEGSLDFGWQAFLRDLDEGVDRSEVALRAALVAGGVVREVPFISGALRDFSVPQPSIVRTAEFNFIVVGGEGHGAQEEFRGRVNHLVQQFGIPTAFDRSLLHNVLDAAGKTIRAISMADPTIGGTIRYGVVRSRVLLEQGVWDG